MDNNEDIDNSMDDFNAAWDEVEKAEAPKGEEDGGTTEHIAEIDESAQRDDSPELRAESGPDDSKPNPDDPDGVQGDPGKPDDSKIQDGPESSAPVSWSAKAREGWKDLPKEARQYIHQREHQMQVGLQKNAEGARRAAAMDQTLSPYQQYFAMSGGAGQTIQGLLQAGATLTMGSPAQRAQTVANIIKQYGVDVNALDSLLVGKPQEPAGQQDFQVQQAIQQALAPYQRYMAEQQQNQQARQQQTQQEAGSEVQRFSADPKNEFYKDVRMDMADILDLAANRGLQMSMEDAYNRACLMHPEISTIVQTRQKQQALLPKKKAAVSISGGQGGAGGSGGAETTRQALEAAWDNYGSV